MSLRQAIVLQPDHARAHNNLGLVLAHTGRLDLSLVEFRQGGCTEADAQINLAYALTLERHWPEAPALPARPGGGRHLRARPAGAAAARPVGGQGPRPCPVGAPRRGPGDRRPDGPAPPLRRPRGLRSRPAPAALRPHRDPLFRWEDRADGRGMTPACPADSPTSPLRSALTRPPGERRG